MTLDWKVRAILEAAAEIGLELQHNHPEIAQAWRDLETRKEIVNKLQLTIDKKVSFDVAAHGIYMALHGNPYECLNTLPYPGLLKEEEIPAVRAAHRRQTAMRNKLQERSLDDRHRWYQEHPLEETSELRMLFSMTLEPEFYFEGKRQRRVRAKKIARELSARTGHEHTATDIKGILYKYKEEWEAFKKQYDKHPFTPYCRPENYRSLAARKAMRRKGIYSWTDPTPDGETPLERLIALTEDPQYHRSNGSFKLKEIAATLNQLYPHRRTPEAVAQALRTYYPQAYKKSG